VLDQAAAVEALRPVSAAGGQLSRLNSTCDLASAQQPNDQQMA